MSGRSTLNYDDALRLLGAQDARIIRIADRIAGVLGVAASAATGGALDLFGLREELVDWGRTVVRQLAARTQPLGRLDRTRLLEAAHGIVVVLAYQEALAEEGGVDLGRVARTLGEVGDLVILGAAAPSADFLEVVTRSALPLPSASRSDAELHRDLRAFYETCTSHLGKVLDVAAPGDGAGLRERSATVAEAAERRYEGIVRELSASVPEFALWRTGIADETTRALLGDLRSDVLGATARLDTGLQGLARVLDSMVSATATSEWRAVLARSYLARLERPVMELSGVTDHLVLPSLGAMYVDPPCRVAIEDFEWVSINESWWQRQPKVADVARYLAGHLTASEATRAPLVIWGQPGAGKSTLARILAARLPATDFLTLVVRLRDVPSDAHLQTQIDLGAQLAVGTRTTWSDLVADAPGALPVLVLDGLDEMLQASARDRPSYLEEVRDFQRQEAERGRPLAIVVTSRPAASHRVRMPSDATLLRLEPFDAEHIGRWVATWNVRNAGTMTTPLPVDLVLRHVDLVEQPLLLLLLALYDLRSGGLAGLPSDSSRADLYEAVLGHFARREVRRDGRAPAPPDEEREVALVMRRLGVAAMAMTNRNRSVIDEAELGADLRALLPTDSHGVDAVVESFYFGHISKATTGTGDRRRSFEFLHGSIGDFLAARLTVGALRELAIERRFLLSRSAERAPDGGLFHATTSFLVLSDRPLLLDLVSQLLRSLPADERDDVLQLLPVLRAEALDPHPTWTHADYAPLPFVVVKRQATYVANLFLLELELRPEGIPIDDAAAFRRFTHLWRSQFGGRTVDGLLSRMRVATKIEWVIQDSGRAYEAVLHRRLQPEDGTPVSLAQSAPWPGPDFVDDHDPVPSKLFYDVVVPSASDAGSLLREVALFGTNGFGELLYRAAPVWSHLGPKRPRPFADGDSLGDRHRLLLEVLLAPEGPMDVEDRMGLYRAALPHDGPEILLLLRRLRLDLPVLGDREVVSFLVERFDSVHRCTDAVVEIIAALVDPEAGIEAMRAAARVYDEQGMQSGASVESAEHGAQMWELLRRLDDPLA